MKTCLSLLAALCLTLTVQAHQGVELGPNGGRILEFSKNESMHGEVVAKDGKFIVALLDKDMKPVAIKDQSLNATKGDRDNPEKLTVEVKDNHFVLPMLEGDEYVIILQYKDSPDAKKITARLSYDASICEECNQQEWLCKCKPEEEEKK